MIKVAPTLGQVDVAFVLSQLWEVAEACFFIDSNEEDYLACSITCFKEDERVTLGLVYTKNGGAARLFNGQMQIVAQSVEKLSQEDYYGFRNMMLRMDNTLPKPLGVSKEDLL